MIARKFSRADCQFRLVLQIVQLGAASDQLSDSSNSYQQSATCDPQDGMTLFCFAGCCLRVAGVCRWSLAT